MTRQQLELIKTIAKHCVEHIDKDEVKAWPLSRWINGRWEYVETTEPCMYFEALLVCVGKMESEGVGYAPINGSI